LKKSFSASHWFKSVEPKTKSSDYQDKVINKAQGKTNKNDILAPFYNRAEQPVKIENQLNKFFVPGWKGESLISKNVKSFIQVLEAFHLDVTQCLQKAEMFSRKQKMAIYEEFISYAEFKTLNCSQLDNHLKFWQEFKNPDSPYKDQINHFFKIFSFRIAVIYLFKIRFILTFGENTDQEIKLKSLLYPNSFLMNAFKLSSSSELKARSLEQNIFNWYRPSKDLEDQLILFKSIYDKISITEFVKTISIKSEEVLDQQTLYSHSLSNKQFGLYLNSLLINFPLWISTLNNKNYCPYKNSNDLEIISCKYSGDFLESIGLSHWLAQENNKDLKWDQILCPDYKNDDFANGLYMKVLNELQFLTFLAEVASIQGHDTKSFLCDVINSHLYNRKSSNDIQKSLIFKEDSLNNSTYDRVILNLIQFPENNPQHYLYQRILSEKTYLKENGFIFVLTPKKIFVPSQKNKVTNLLQELKIEGVFDLTEITGKGEVGHYLYIFSNKNSSLKSTPKNKHTCLSFRFNANLKTFHEFEKMTHMTYEFFKKNLGELPPMAQLYNGQFRMEFYQNAIMDGQLIHSSSKDSTSITHPSFFNQLMKLCRPLDYFFDIQAVHFDSRHSGDDSQYLNLENSSYERAPFVIIVDQRIKNNVRLEIIPSNLLEAKAYEYGHAHCHYFYGFSKWPDLNVYAILDFLESSIGKQIINLTFSNDIRRVKGNLSKILVPSFYTNSKKMPEHISTALNLFKVSADDLLNIHPRDLEKNFSELECLILKIAKEYPAQILNDLTSFKKTVQRSIENLQNNDSHSTVNFNNPLLKSPLLLSKTYPIYPENEEIYIEFSSDAGQNIHSQLTHTKTVNKKIGEDEVFFVELFAGEKALLKLHSDKDMVQFLKFILDHAEGVPISTILQSVSVPRIEDLKSILNSFNSLCRTLTEVAEKITPIQNRLLNSVILAENNI
tara:strand:- start:7442 stop:10291 length:2850 start_codon:yes stop_codon:yes gene_type:complete